MTLQERFWSKVEKTPTCWLWTAGKNHCGYGIFSMPGRRCVLAHRVSYELAFGHILPGVCVLHTCHTPACVRPAHLYLGTPADNATDRKHAKRGKNPVHIGIKHPMAKLDEDQVREIRASQDAPRILAQRFGVTTGLIWLIRRRKLWQHID